MSSTRLGDPTPSARSSVSVVCAAGSGWRRMKPAGRDDVGDAAGGLKREGREERQVLQLSRPAPRAQARLRLAYVGTALQQLARAPQRGPAAGSPTVGLDGDGRGRLDDAAGQDQQAAAVGLQLAVSDPRPATRPGPGRRPPGRRRRAAPGPPGPAGGDVVELALDRGRFRARRPAGWRGRGPGSRRRRPGGEAGARALVVEARRRQVGVRRLRGGEEPAEEVDLPADVEVQRRGVRDAAGEKPGKLNTVPASCLVSVRRWEP